MDYNEFKDKIKNSFNLIDLNLSEIQIEGLYKFMHMVLEKNKVLNLTSITNEDDFITKHILDSLTSFKFVKNAKSLIDIGTGAGFPAVPLKIALPDLYVTPVDSVNKKLEFIQQAVTEIGLKDINCVHQRAEDLGRDPAHRGGYDCAIARAVAKLPVLLEYCLPLVKKNGLFIAMKSGNVDEELDMCDNALKVLQGKVKSVEKLELPGSDIKRSIVVFELTGKVPIKYPRKAGTPVRKPL